MIFQDPDLNEITYVDPFRRKIISFSRNCDFETTNAKSGTDASIWVMFGYKNSDTLEKAKHSLFNSPIIIRRKGFHFRSTDLADSGSICKQT